MYINYTPRSNKMTYDSKVKSRSYYPVFCGNGDIAFPITCEGTINHNKSDYPQYTAQMHGEIFRAGRRLIHRNHCLASFGVFSFHCGATCDHFTQSLDLPENRQYSVCDYSDGSTVDSEYFVSIDRPMYLLRKTYHGKPKKIAYSYALYTGGSVSPTVMIPKFTKTSTKVTTMDFVLYGRDKYTGRMTFFSDSDFEARFEEKKCVLEKEVKDGETFTLGFFLEDDFGGTDYIKETEKAISDFEKLGYDGLFDDSSKKWQEYFGQYFVKTGDKKADDIYMTALYHMKVNTTKWSIPVGLNGYVWSGRYFAFDEYYCMLGLLTSGRRELAKRVPAFRLANLETAKIRAMGGRQLRYVWESNEYCEEGAPPGHWMDHVFHMAVIALGAFEYYEYTLDRDFLAECYPMIAGCAEFYIKQMLYEDCDGRIFVGKCTDLERLGNAKLNPFMTGCGIIKTLEVCAKASGILGIDADFAKECREYAQRLRANLPSNEKFYLPYHKAETKSIGILSCKFPYDVLDKSDEKMLRSVNDYSDNSNAVGNMYNVGQGVCPWYACWEAMAFARLGDKKKAYSALKKCYSSVGEFNNINEINEPGRQHHPWFATAAGSFLSSVNEMLVRCDGDFNVTILPAYEAEDKDISFRLPIKGNRDIEVEIKDGKLISAVITDNTSGDDITDKFNITF